MVSHPTLAALSPGEGGIILSLAADPLSRRRLWELGFVPGNEIRALFRAPSGDPTAYAVCGTVIALRRADAAKILLSSSGKV